MPGMAVRLRVKRSLVLSQTAKETALWRNGRTAATMTQRSGFFTIYNLQFTIHVAPTDSF
jgi:hypothetical protein